MPEDIWKSIRVKENTHAEFKSEASIARMSHDEYINWLRSIAKFTGAYPPKPVHTEPQPTE